MVSDHDRVMIEIAARVALEYFERRRGADFFVIPLRIPLAIDQLCVPIAVPNVIPHLRFCRPTPDRGWVDDSGPLRILANQAMEQLNEMRVAFPGATVPALHFRDRFHAIAETCAELFELDDLDQPESCLQRG